jgi:hypothetical protein
VAGDRVGAGQIHCQSLSILVSAHLLLLCYLILGEKNRRKERESRLVRKKSERESGGETEKETQGSTQTKMVQRGEKRRDKDQEWRRGQANMTE